MKITIIRLIILGLIISAVLGLPYWLFGFPPMEKGSFLGFLQTVMLSISIVLPLLFWSIEDGAAECSDCIENEPVESEYYGVLGMTKIKGDGDES
jgi:hypothetical protein